VTVRCEGLSKSFATRAGLVSALEDVSFAARPEEFLCIVGPSGCGKTTLLKVIAGLVRPTGGRVMFETEPAGGRLRAALVFQEHDLFPWMTVLDNAAFSLETRGIARRVRRERVRALVDRVGLGPFAASYPHELSVGMRQRVAILRALIADPEILLLDEPFGALDAQTRLVLQAELLSAWRDHKKLVIHVTHDIDEALRLADRILVMSGRPGRIREEIPVPASRPRDVSSPEPPELAGLKRRIWAILQDEVRASLSVPE
jgi:NitT/TauT family transport system ATP-binding protein